MNMKRENEVPASLLAYLEQQKKQQEWREKNQVGKLDIYCTIPVRAVKMKILGDDGKDQFRTVVIPSVDVYLMNRPKLKPGYFRREAMSYFVAGTRKAFPYGHVYIDSGCICLGNIFVPSAVPEMSVTMPLETLFLHNDRNLSHGNNHLSISREKAARVERIIRERGIVLSKLADVVIKRPGADIIMNDEIWNLGACVAEQMPLPQALNTMTSVYDVIFKKYDMQDDGMKDDGTQADNPDDLDDMNDPDNLDDLDDLDDMDEEGGNDHD